MSAAGWVHLPKSDEHRAFVARLALEFDTIDRPENGADVNIRFLGEPALRTENSRLFMLGPDATDAMLDAVQSGAAGYLPMTRSLQEIVNAAISVSCGRAVVPDEMLGALLRQVVRIQRQRTDEIERLEVLTPREREVFQLAARGMDKFKIASKLGMSPATARTHLGNIMRKMEIRSRAELVAAAATMGIDTTPLGG
jgi:DNA-binding NarL/FixJ family response regulator